MTVSKVQLVWLRVLNRAKNHNTVSLPKDTRAALLRKGLVVPTVFDHVELTDSGRNEIAKRAATLRAEPIGTKEG